jgi:CheY-like chemotaxis protein/anti-sigma regulatory factor (Ser/Thr protein kinase)
VLVNNILDLFRLQNDKMNLDLGTFPLSVCLLEACSEVTAQATAKHINISCNINANIPCEITTDRARMRQVLVQLLKNAVKFTSDNGEITVSAELCYQDNKNMLLISVQDNGIGISSENIPSLFGMFSQVDSSATRKFGGTGLGLAISKALVEMMHGTIWCESTLGLGSTFFFTIELMDMAPFCSPSPKMTSVCVSPKPVASPSLLSSSAEISPRILVVDDTLINLKIMKKMLEALGYTDIDAASNGEEALTYVQKHNDNPYDVILMDIQMPIMDGVSCAQRIRSIQTLQKQPHIIAVTANSFQEDIKRYMDAGMCEHIAKPIKKDHIRYSLEEYMTFILPGQKQCACKKTIAAAATTATTTAITT